MGQVGNVIYRGSMQMICIASGCMGRINFHFSPFYSSVSQKAQINYFAEKVCFTSAVNVFLTSVREVFARLIGFLYFPSTNTANYSFVNGIQCAAVDSGCVNLKLLEYFKKYYLINKIELSRLKHEAP